MEIDAVPGTADILSARSQGHLQHKDWHFRGYIPHFDADRLPQFITFRLTGSLPQSLLLKWNESVKRLPDHQAEPALRRLVEAYLDKGLGLLWLEKKHIASMVQNALLHFDRVRYDLYSWVIMPNHVHILIAPFEGYPIPDIMRSLKSFTANRANQLLERSGRFRHADYFDRYIRDESHFHKVVKYIENNPVKAGLCASVEEWAFSSAGINSRGQDVRGPGKSKPYDRTVC